MAKALYISEKPSVAREFAKALNMDFKNQDGYMEAPQAVVTWCVGHLVTMSYPEVYDQKYKKWSLATLPFLPEKFKYEVISGVKKQYKIVAGVVAKPQGRGTDLRVHGLWARRGIYLSPGGTSGKRKRQRAQKSMD